MHRMWDDGDLGIRPFEMDDPVELEDRVLSRWRTGMDLLMSPNGMYAVYHKGTLYRVQKRGSCFVTHPEHPQAVRDIVGDVRPYVRYLFGPIPPLPGGPAFFSDMDNMLPLIDPR